MVAGEASAAGDAVPAAGEAALSVGAGSVGALLQPTAEKTRAARHEIPTIRAVRRRLSILNSPLPQEEVKLGASIIPNVVCARML